jgi:beta-galactosidase
VCCRGYMDTSEDLTDNKGLLPDSYLDVSKWGKGLAFINGFNLGWYWPSKGPASTM